ncbi:MAG: 23S rRNA (uracil(1939)-C(5))-methyltransferase RlmD [Candidatus Binatia bacterium]
MVGDVVRCRIESLAYGAAGVARTDAGVVLVPGVAPGDEIEARIVAEHPRWRDAEVVRLIVPGAARREPPCPHARECGGCTWQQVDYTTQLAAKERALRDQLARLGGFDVASLDVRPILASEEWAYRHRVTLRVAGENKLGFYRHRSHRLVEIDRCLIADETVNEHLATARAWLRGVSTTVRRLEIASAAPAEVIFVANAEGRFRNDDEYHERFLRETPAVRGIVMFGKGWRRTFGAPRVELDLGGGTSIESEGGFTQVNPAGNRKLVEMVLALAEPRADDRVLDLFCGAGNLTVPLARRVGGTVGVDVAGTSIQAARRNVDALGLSGCRFHQQAAAQAAKSLAAEGERFSLVVLDPPREGATAVLEHLPALASDRLVYVSCNPATLARDLARLVALGFRLGPIQPIDLFPQTHHLETVVRLERR